MGSSMMWWLVAVTGILFIFMGLPADAWVYTGLLILLILLLVAGWRKIPPDVYAWKTTFGKRGAILQEGWHWIIPIIQDIQLPVKEELIRTPVKVSMFSSDNLEIIIEGSVHWRVDTCILRKFVQVTFSAITDGLADLVKNEIGIIAGVRKASSFIGQREAIAMLIDCQLRLPEPTHVNPTIIGLPPGRIKPKERLKFYSDNATAIQALLRDEKTPARVNERSFIESKFGIDIEDFALAQVDFSSKVKEAMEAERKAQGEVRAAEVREKKKKEWMNDNIAAGMDPVDAEILAGRVVDQEIPENYYTIGGGVKKLCEAALARFATPPMPPPIPPTPPTPPPPAPKPKKRRKPNKSGSGHHKPGCPGILVHCPGCRP